ncbi:sensor histidine kinase [Tenacibaculum sp. KUL118]|nr:sensor histidine kinase [Tenacibaculum sp. KUL118]
MTQFKHGFYTLFIMASAILGCLALSHWFLPLGGILLILQLACAIVALTTSRFYGLLAGLAGALSFNYFFTAPLYSFQIAEIEDSINFVVFILVAILMSELAVYVNAQQHALQVVKTQSRILRSVSHDLRTPLSTIIGSVETYTTYQDKLEEIEKKALLQGVYDEGKRLYIYVENLLQATRIEHNALVLNLTRINLTSLLASIESRINNRRLKVVNISSSECITASESLFEQALFNVIDNALTFSDDAVSLTVSKTDTKFEFEIQDTGKGLSKEQLKAPFQLFQTSRSSDSGKGGIGLGLSVTAGIVHAHQGDIKLLNTTPGLRVCISMPIRD